jgi:hypothetical protein
LRAKIFGFLFLLAGAQPATNTTATLCGKFYIIPKASACGIRMAVGRKYPVQALVLSGAEQPTRSSPKAMLTFTSIASHEPGISLTSNGIELAEIRVRQDSHRNLFIFCWNLQGPCHNTHPILFWAMAIFPSEGLSFTGNLWLTLVGSYRDSSRNANSPIKPMTALLQL